MVANSPSITRPVSSVPTYDNQNKANEIMLKIITGFITGILNGLLGGGAGLICVPMPNKIYNDTKKAQAYTVATVLAATIVSVIIYFIKGDINISSSWKYTVGGALSAPVGVFILKKSKSKFNSNTYF